MCFWALDAFTTIIELESRDLAYVIIPEARICHYRQRDAMCSTDFRPTIQVQKQRTIWKKIIRLSEKPSILHKPINNPITKTYSFKTDSVLVAVSNNIIHNIVQLNMRSSAMDGAAVAPATAAVPIKLLDELITMHSTMVPRRNSIVVNMTG